MSSVTKGIRTKVGGVAGLLMIAMILLNCRGDEVTLPKSPHHMESTRAEDESSSPKAQKSSDEVTKSPNLPENHTVDWLQRHAAVARTNAQNCMECHKQRDCASCHTDDVTTPFKVHPPNFATIHAANPRLQGSNCEQCHKPETFCTSCHAKANVNADESSSPPAGYGVHPEGWLEPSNPRNHGKMARRNITECTSCHTERDCVTCHQQVNPHPPDFRMNCRQWLEANARPCMECHASRSELKMMCR